MTTTTEFDYLGEKVQTADFIVDPFPHLIIEEFLSTEHFALLINDSQINLPTQKTTAELIDTLLKRGWQVQQFPGCTISIDQYLRCYEKDEWPVDKKRLEGFGMAFRLKDYENSAISNLVNYLNSKGFKESLERKFQISRSNRIETAIHKYLSGYEISPHPDIRSKCLTYLVNINTSSIAESLDIHTHLLRFNQDKQFIYHFWKLNEKFDRDWVPWEWCQSVKQVRKNNTLLMFAPAWDTLHAIKLRYDHLNFQRTQLYGNLWYTDVKFALPLVNYTQFTHEFRQKYLLCHPSLSRKFDQ
jgi:hypothetical protein